MHTKPPRSYDHVERRLRAAGALTQAGPSLVGVAFAEAAAEALPGLAVVGAHSPPPPPPPSADGKGRGGEEGGGTPEPASASSSSSSSSSSPYYLTPESYAPMCYVARRRRPYPGSTQTLTRVSPFEVRV